MNRREAELDRVIEAPIDLASRSPFTLAHLTVTPAALCVASGAWTQRLEPRAMQVLVVLAEGAPDVVGRATLNARVWGGRVVGDDAINRAVQTLRRLAADAPAPAPFAIATVPRVGYRLTAAPPTPVPDAAPAPASVVSAPIAPPVVKNRARWWAVVGPVVLIALVAWWLLRAPELSAWRVAGATSFADLPPGARDLALSPDGARLAYRGKDGAGRERIWVRAAERGGPGTPVSPPDIDAHRPAWSPNGADLAFVAYDPGQPCRLFVRRAGAGAPARALGTCETAREPHLAWTADARALLFGDAPGWNAVPRVVSIGVVDGRRTVISSPPGDGMGDDLPMPLGDRIVYRRQFAYGDEGWIARDPATGRERVLWRRHGVIGSAGAALPGGTLVIAWTRAGASALDLVTPTGTVTSQPLAPGPVTGIAGAGARLLIETDHSESALVRGAEGAGPPKVLATVRGRIRGPLLLPDGRVRFPVVSAGEARLWEADPAGSVRPWGAFVAAAIVGPALSPDGRLTAALIVEGAGREIVVFDAKGVPVFRWQPSVRTVNSGAWSADGRRLIVPVLDGAGWRLVELDPFGRAAPRDLGMAGFATVASSGAAMYAVRAGEAMGIRELWRLDPQPRRLPFDTTLLDVVNWQPSGAAIWLPDRRHRDHPRLTLRDDATGRVLRTVDAPGLAGASSGLAADVRGPIYVQTVRDEPDYTVLTLARAR